MKMEAAVRTKSTRFRPQRRHAVVEGDGGITRRSNGEGRDGSPGRGVAKSELLTQVLEVLAGLESDRPTGRDSDFLACSGIASDSALAGFHLKDPEAPE